MGLVERVAVLVVEATDAGTEHNGRRQGRYAACHVNRARTGQVNDAATPERIGGSRRQEPVGRPKGVRDDWIDKADQKDRVEEVGLHLGPLGDCSGHNARQSASKGKLEKPVFESNVVVALEKESLVADERLFRGIVLASVGESVPDRPKGDSSSARVEQVPEDHVLDVLGADGSGAEHL